VAAPSASGSSAVRLAERVGRSTFQGVGAVGYGALVLRDSLVWVLLGRRRHQPVRTAPVFSQMMEIGIRALPIVTMLAFTIGLMLAIQGIHALEPFGAQHQVMIGIGLSVTREFAPLITGILVAGRSGSALAARLGTMTITNEIDALEVMGINPVRFLVVPSFLAMLIMLPALTLWADLVSLFGAGLYVTTELGMNASVYVDETVRYLSVDDLLHGLSKSAIFAVLITIIGVVDGTSVSGGAEGVGRVTTRSVVHAISAIILVDMVFAFAMTR
jgi:phospholipid/cholesterol/gamma-HCH transport system permease protein